MEDNPDDLVGKPIFDNTTNDFSSMRSLNRNGN